MSLLRKILLTAKYAKKVQSLQKGMIYCQGIAYFAKKLNALFGNRKRLFGVHACMASLFVLIVACHAPVPRPTSDEDFKALLEKSKSYTTYPYHTDSALMILHELLPGQQSVRRGWVLNMMGVSYDIQGVYDSAAFYLYEASRVAEEARDDSLQISVYTNLGMLQFAQKNADESVAYYQKAMAIAEKMKHSKGIANLLNNIGNTYMTLTHDYEQAIHWLERCRQVSEEIGYVDGCRTAGFNLAQIYNDMGELDKAYNEINHIIELYGYDRFGGFLLGEIDFKRGNYRQAVQTFQGLMTVPLVTRELEVEILKMIAETYKAYGILDSTVFYLEKTYALRDSLHNQQTAQTINKLKIEYETEKKDTEISVLKAEKRLMTGLFIAGGGVLMLILASFFFLWRWTVQKRRLDEQRIRQLEQEKQLVATLAVLDGEIQERIRIARDLHDSLGSILVGAKLNLQEMQKGALLNPVSYERFNAAIGLLDESVVEMRRVAHHLMPETLVGAGLIQSLADFCNAIPTASFNYYGDETRFDPKREAMVYRIVHELVTNALKHSGASHILVQIVKEVDAIALTVQDNGCGFDPNVVSKGMGLNNIRNRVAAFNGNLMVDSKADVGTEINVELGITN